MGVALPPAAGAQSLSDDATLSLLSFESDLRQTKTFPAFDADVTRYDVAVPSGSTEMKVRAAANHGEATIVLESTPPGQCCIRELAYDANTGTHTLELRTDRRSTYVTITVTAEDGETTKTYIVYVDIASTEALGWRVYNDVPLDRLVDDTGLPSHHIRAFGWVTWQAFQAS